AWRDDLALNGDALVGPYADGAVRAPEVPDEDAAVVQQHELRVAPADRRVADDDVGGGGRSEGQGRRALAGPVRGSCRADVDMGYGAMCAGCSRRIRTSAPGWNLTSALPARGLPSSPMCKPFFVDETILPKRPRFSGAGARRLTPGASQCAGAA